MDLNEPKIAEEPKDFVRAEFSKGAYIFTEGEPGDLAYVIQKGSVEIVKGLIDKTRLGTRSKGEVIGEMALFDDSARIATVIALEDTVVIGISREAFQGRLNAMDPPMRAIMENLVSRLAELSVRMVTSKTPDNWKKRS